MPRRSQLLRSSTAWPGDSSHRLPAADRLLFVDEFARVVTAVEDKRESAYYRAVMPVRTVLERGPKGRKAVAFAVDWPGWSRGAKTAELALEVLESYRARYRQIAVAAGMADEFDSSGPLDVVEDRIGTGSTDFWGISFSPSGLEHEPMDDSEFGRKIGLLHACWGFFDDVGARVSAEMRKGGRGGGRDRDQIIRHTIRTGARLLRR